jgi:hypothetical protein
MLSKLRDKELKACQRKRVQIHLDAQFRESSSNPTVVIQKSRSLYSDPQKMRNYVFFFGGDVPFQIGFEVVPAKRYGFATVATERIHDAGVQSIETNVIG